MPSICHSGKVQKYHGLVVSAKKLREKLHLTFINSKSHMFCSFWSTFRLICPVYEQMGVAAVVHLKVFPARPYRRGERCVRNVAVMSDYASLGTPPDPEEVRDGGRLTRGQVVQPENRERRLSFPQSVRDVVLGSSEIVCSSTL